MALKGPDLKSYSKIIGQLPEDVRGNIEKRMARVAKHVQTQQEMRIPVNKYTAGGDLKRGQRSSVKMNKKSLRMSFWNKEFYAGFVEFGTGPLGQSYPATVLPEGVSITYTDEGWVWFSEEMNDFVFTYGQPARQFFYPPIFDNIELMRSEWENAVKEGFEAYAKRTNKQ